MARDITYENTNIIYNEQYPEGGIKCKNHKLCKSILPKWWWNSNECYLCTNCEMVFGELTFKEMECPICFDFKNGLSPLKCDHFICIDCFQRCYYGDEDKDNEPHFPYPELEEEYFNHPDLDKWNHYPFIRIFHEEWIMWDEKRIEKYDNEESLRKCPLCRK
jgi:hypothetical protein